MLRARRVRNDRYRSQRLAHFQCHSARLERRRSRPHSGWPATSVAHPWLGSRRMLGRKTGRHRRSNGTPKNRLKSRRRHRLRFRFGLPDLCYSPTPWGWVAPCVPYCSESPHVYARCWKRGPRSTTSPSSGCRYLSCAAHRSTAWSWQWRGRCNRRSASTAGPRSWPSCF